MQRLTKVEEKLQVLRSILNGEADISILRAPHNYCIMQNEAGLYELPGGLLCNEETLQQWLINIRQHDTAIVLKQAPGCAPLIEEENILTREAVSAEIEAIEDIQFDYADADYLPENAEADIIYQTDEAPVKTPVIAPQHIHEGKLSEYGETWGSICYAD